MGHRAAVLGVCALGIGGCGGGGSSRDSDASAEGSSGIGSMSATAASSSAGTTESGGATDSTGAMTGTTQGSTVADTSTGDGPKFDVGGGDEDLPVDACAGGKGGGGVDFSYIWIADSSQNAVSKIHTQTMVEESIATRWTS